MKIILSSESKKWSWSLRNGGGASLPGASYMIISLMLALMQKLSVLVLVPL